MKKLVAWLLVMLLCFAMVCVHAEEEGEPKLTPSLCIVCADSLGDRSFYDSAYEGAKRLEADFGTEIGVMECMSDPTLCEPYLFEAAEHYDVVAAVGWQFWDALESGAVLASFPDVKFIFIDNGLDGCGDNLMSVIYKQNEGSFLVGYIAAKLSTTGIVGAVGGENSDTINDFLVGYKAGAEYANADIQVMFNYTNDYEDPAKGKEAALALYSKGCDVIFQVASKTGEGVFEAAAENGFYAIGVDGDQKYINPEVILCSMMKDVGSSIYDILADMDANYLPGQIKEADMSTGYVQVVYGTEDMTQQVSDELKAEVEVLKEKIISGEIVVPSAFSEE